MMAYMLWHKYSVAQYILEKLQTDELIPDKGLTSLNHKTGLVEYIGEPTSYKFRFIEIAFEDLLNDDKYDTDSLIKAKRLLHVNSHIEIKKPNNKEIIKITDKGKVAIANDFYIGERNKMIAATLGIAVIVIPALLWTINKLKFLATLAQ